MDQLSLWLIDCYIFDYVIVINMYRYLSKYCKLSFIIAYLNYTLYSASFISHSMMWSAVLSVFHYWLVTIYCVLPYFMGS